MTNNPGLHEDEKDNFAEVDRLEVLYKEVSSLITVKGKATDFISNLYPYRWQVINPDTKSVLVEHTAMATSPAGPFSAIQVPGEDGLVIYLRSDAPKSIGYMKRIDPRSPNVAAKLEQLKQTLASIQPSRGSEQFEAVAKHAADMVIDKIWRSPAWQIAMRATKLMGLPVTQVPNMAMAFNEALIHYKVNGYIPQTDFDKLPTLKDIEEKAKAAEGNKKQP